MQLLVNDLSIHSQFQDISTFRGALDSIMAIRQMTRKYGLELHCNRNVATRHVAVGLTLLQVIQSLPREQKQSAMQWLTRQGPFWDDFREHSAEDYLELECDANIVTDTAVGEAAYRCIYGIEHWLVSFAPSQWEKPLIDVIFRSVAGDKSIQVQNYWIESSLETALQNTPKPIASWQQMEQIIRARCTKLIVSVEAFNSLQGCPFVSSAAQRICCLLSVLDKFKNCFDEHGQRTPEGHDIYHNFFTGKKGGGGAGAIFKDSSDDEKNKFQKEMTFLHPADPNTTLFCPWHGRIQTPQMRIHFSWPMTADDPAYVVYIGPKITKR